MQNKLRSIKTRVVAEWSTEKRRWRIVDAPPDDKLFRYEMSPIDLEGLLEEDENG